jgi:hypothetical protein
MFSIYKAYFWIAKKSAYYPIEVVAVYLEGSKLPHFGLIYDLPLEEAINMHIEGVWPFLRMFLGEHSDEQKWDWKDWWPGNKSLLLVPKRYIGLTISFFVFSIYLVPKRKLVV